MRIYLRRVLVAAAAVLCGVALSVSGPVALAADSSTPTLTLTPATGPPGTHVVISGHLTATQLPVWTPMLTASGIFALLTDLQGCELVGVTTDETIHVDTATGDVTGSFVVGSTGTCVQSDPDALTHAAPAGEYRLSIGCLACQVGSFTLTKAAATLPATGFPVGTACLCASGLLVVGLFLCARRRST